MFYKLLSLDIWDTVLRRKCASDEDKMATAGYITLKYYNELRPEYRHQLDVFRARQDIV